MCSTDAFPALIYIFLCFLVSNTDQEVRSRTASPILLVELHRTLALRMETSVIYFHPIKAQPLRSTLFCQFSLQSNYRYLPFSVFILHFAIEHRRPFIS